MIRILEQFISLGTLVRNLDAFLPTTIEGTSPESPNPWITEMERGSQHAACVDVGVSQGYAHFSFAEENVPDDQILLENVKDGLLG